MRFHHLVVCALLLAGDGIVGGTTLHGCCPGECANDAFEFCASPGSATGVYVVDLLVPDNEDPNPAAVSYSFNGPLSGSATLFSTTAWTTGQLDSYLGISAKPADPVGAFLPSTLFLDAGATGFYVYQVNLGSATLPGPSQPGASPFESIVPGIPQGLVDCCVPEHGYERRTDLGRHCEWERDLRERHALGTRRDARARRSAGDRDRADRVWLT